MAESSYLQTSLKSIRSISFSSASSYYSSLEYELNFERKHKLYGDIVVAVCMSFAAPALAFRMFSEGGLENFDAAVLVGSVGVSAIFHFLAWKYDSVLCSRLAFLANCFSGSFMGTYAETMIQHNDSISHVLLTFAPFATF